MGISRKQKFKTGINRMYRIDRIKSKKSENQNPE
jgi:hypothetical protein